MTTHVLIAVLVLAAPVLAQTVSYEASTFPEEQGGWFRILQPDPYQAARWLEDGWLVQFAEVVDDGQYLVGQQDNYRRELDDQAGLPTWFLQFRLIADAPPHYFAVAPAALAAGGNSGVNYHFVIGDNQIRFLRDVSLPYVYVDIEASQAHTYRLELGPGSYVLYVDGVNVAAGVPEGPYPTADSAIVFSCTASGQSTMVHWDYVRLGGPIPAPASGDYNSDSLIDHDDLYFFIDCLMGPDYDAAGPGCRWADVDGDGRASGSDIPLFVNLMIGP